MRTRRRSALLIAALLATGDFSFAAGPAIEHKSLSCIVAGKFPRLDACFAPEDDVSRARVHFRAEGTEHWYFVDMVAPGACRSVLLPKPLPSTPAVDYYVSVLGRAFEETRTSDYTPRVVRRAGDCDRDLLVAAGVAGGTVLLGAVAGASATPPGFSPDGIVAAPSASSAARGGGAGAGVVLGLAAVGGGGYLLYKQLSDEELVGDPPPSSPYEGAWSGTTSQNRPLTFGVFAAAISSFDTALDLGSANGQRVTTIQRTFSPGLLLSGGTFTFQQPGEPPLTVTGTLTTNGTAEGRIETGGRAVVTWRATRR